MLDAGGYEQLWLMVVDHDLTAFLITTARIHFPYDVVAEKRYAIRQ